MDDRVCEVAFVFALVICLMQVNKVLFLAFSLNAEVQEEMRPCWWNYPQAPELFMVVSVVVCK